MTQRLPPSFCIYTTATHQDGSPKCRCLPISVLKRMTQNKTNVLLLSQALFSTNEAISYQKLYQQPQYHMTVTAVVSLQSSSR